MHPSVEPVRPHVAMLCRRLGVRRVDLVGAAADDGFDADDVELLVDLGTARDDPLDVRAALKRGVEGLLGRPVEILVDDELDDATRTRIGTRRACLWSE